MGHLALENKQLQDGQEQGSTDATVGEGNSQGEKANDNHILRIIIPLETQSHRDSVTSAEKKLDFMFLYTSDRPLMKLRSGHPTCSTWRMLMCLFVLGATAAEHNSRTSQLCHFTVRGERKGKWFHLSSLSLLTMAAK